MSRKSASAVSFWQSTAWLVRILWYVSATEEGASSPLRTQVVPWYQSLPLWTRFEASHLGQAVKWCLAKTLRKSVHERFGPKTYGQFSRQFNSWFHGSHPYIMYAPQAPASRSYTDGSPHVSHTSVNFIRAIGASESCFQYHQVQIRTNDFQVDGWRHVPPVALQGCRFFSVQASNGSPTLLISGRPFFAGQITAKSLFYSDLESCHGPWSSSQGSFLKRLFHFARLRDLELVNWNMLEPLVLLLCDHKVTGNFD